MLSKVGVSTTNKVRKQMNKDIKSGDEKQQHKYDRAPVQAFNFYPKSNIKVKKGFESKLAADKETEQIETAKVQAGKEVLKKLGSMFQKKKEKSPPKCPDTPIDLIQL